MGAFTITKNLIRDEGIMKLYAGLSASLMRQAIYGTARLGLHRVFTNKLKERNGGSISFFASSLSSITSGALAGMIGNPFDIAMVRMQADGLLPKEQRAATAIASRLLRVLRERRVCGPCGEDVCP